MSELTFVPHLQIRLNGFVERNSQLDLLTVKAGEQALGLFGKSIAGCVPQLTAGIASQSNEISHGCKEDKRQLR